MNTCLVQTEGGNLSCTLSSRLTKQLPSDQVVVGDEVQLVETGSGQGQILAILPRRNRFSRRAAVSMPSAHASEQVIAANVDQVIPVFAAADPTPSWHLLDRYLVSAE